MSKVARPLKKRKDDLTAIAGAQLDWEHRKIRVKGGRETYRSSRLLGRGKERGCHSVGKFTIEGFVKL